MKPLWFLFLAAIVLISSCDAATGITISHAWARPTAQGENGAVYFLLQNHSASRDELTGISCAVAETVEMHETKMDGDVMRMRQVTSVAIAGKASIEFAPGGYHVMLAGLKQPLTIGEEIEITLHFRDHQDIVLAVPVLEQGDEAMNDH